MDYNSTPQKSIRKAAHVGRLLCSDLNNLKMFVSEVKIAAVSLYSLFAAIIIIFHGLI